MTNIDALKITSQLIDSFQTVRDTVAQIERDQDFYEREYLDLTHALEIISFNASEGYKLAKQLKENRHNRRNAKNTKEQLMPLHDLMKRYNNFFKELKSVHSQIEVTRNIQRKRAYTPRVREDLQEAFDRAQGKAIKLKSKGAD